MTNFEMLQKLHIDYCIKIAILSLKVTKKKKRKTKDTQS